MEDTVKNEVRFSDEKLNLVKEIISRYPEGRQKSALLPVLHIAQREFGGWLSPQVMDYVASLLSIQPIEVYEVATFYTMFNLEPIGHCMIEFCRTGPCMTRGVEEVIDYAEQKLGIKEGETTPDGKFTIKCVECLGSCGSAPMAQIGKFYYENLTPEKIDKIVEIFSDPESDTFKKYDI
ncbi:NAD(P)H-dependent oxidoreductase subunit E [Cytophagaceae bacterium ABcell3]|nr:NAD(P)H-dependent oxidoreductase subunit E [Cytophagaceae bacterium ABcell3]